MVRITGPDFAQLEKERKFVADLLKTLPNTTDMRLDANPPKPELAVNIDRVRAADLGLSSAALGSQLRLAINDKVAAKLHEGKDETDIRVRLSERDRALPDNVRRM